MSTVFRIIMKFRTMLSLLLVSVLVCVGGYILYVRHNNYRNSREAMTCNKNIFELVQQNIFFRKELVTGAHSQVVLMSIPVGGEIGLERHNKIDQILVFVAGHGQAIINGEVSEVYEQSLVFVPAGAEHNFKNTVSKELKLFTIYAPPEHEPGTLEKTKSE